MLDTLPLSEPICGLGHVQPDATYPPVVTPSQPRENGPYEMILLHHYYLGTPSMSLWIQYRISLHFFKPPSLNLPKRAIALSSWIGQLRSASNLPRWCSIRWQDTWKVSSIEKADQLLLLSPLPRLFGGLGEWSDFSEPKSRSI